MKKLIAVLISFIFCVSAFAQADVTKFLGFPVDGTKANMERNLKSKGFKLSNIKGTDFLTGRFNGVDVNVAIVTENGKVSRIMVADANMLNLTDIKVRFNILCQQFIDNGKYLPLGDFIIPDKEDISYEMIVNKKRYEAAFYQLPPKEEFEKIGADIIESLCIKHGVHDIVSASDELKKTIESEFYDVLSNNYSHKMVWFMISEVYGKYYITMFYDNELNRAQGEDL